MNRLTKALDRNNFYIVDDTKVQHDANRFFGEAINKLGMFENVYDDLISKQNKIIEEMEKLRSEDKTNSVKFKQLLANKLGNNNILILFKSYGIE